MDPKTKNVIHYDAEELARRGAVGGSLLRRVRHHEELCKRIKELVLFGPERATAPLPGDHPLVQLLIEQARIYEDARDIEGDDGLDMRQRVLASMTTMLLGVTNKEQAMFGDLLKLVVDIYKANLKNAGKNDIINMSDRDLMEMAGEQLKKEEPE